MSEANTGVNNWRLDTDGAGIAWLGLDTPGSTNVLSRAVLLQLDQILNAFEKAPPHGLVIYSCKDSGFIAGADVREFPDLRNEEHAIAQIERGQAVLARLESMPFTTVAVLNGITLGGGLELALACDWRIAQPSDRPVLGLPEVQLGVHPGLGGTVRTVRLLGVRAAMQLMLAGKSVRPEAALKMGLIDEICEPQDWEKCAAASVKRERIEHSVPLLDKLLNAALLRPLLAPVLAKQVRAKANPAHYPAPYAMIDLWRRYGASDAGYAAEARSFAKLVFGPTSQNLQRVFFLQDRMKDLGKSSDAQFKHVHVVGAGTMGADIAAWCAIQGLSVTLQDRDGPAVEAGMQRATKTIRRKLKKDTLAENAIARMVADLTGEGARSADVVIEAIFEDLTAKQELFAQLEQRCRKEALLATNTSSIPLDQIAAALQQPQRLIGLHFFNPVALMPLVEVVRSETSAEPLIAAGLSFVKQIGKLPLPCRSLPGFLVNRILAPYLDEACQLYTEGVPAEAIDRAAVDFGMPVGPLELADSVGLDILVHVAEILGETIHRPIPQALTDMVAKGRLGTKSGRGFYEWRDGKAVKTRSSAAGGDAQDRMIFSLLNEAAACVADNVVSESDLVDAGTIFGAGFAPFRGGPLQHARSLGLEATEEQLNQLSKRHGERFTPSSGWQQLRTNA